jgi:hypothetical protein
MTFGRHHELIDTALTMINGRQGSLYVNQMSVMQKPMADECLYNIGVSQGDQMI